MGAKSETRRNRAYRACFAVLNDAGISDKSDRIQLAKILLDLGEADITSFKQLSVGALEDLRFALMSWRTVQELRLANGVLEREALALAERVKSGEPTDSLGRPFTGE